MTPKSAPAVASLAVMLFSYGLCMDYPFRDTTLPWEARVEDLVDRLSLKEMVDQMAYGGGAIDTLASVPRLGIKPYNFNTECLRGVVKPNKATAFPQSVGLTATFSPDIIFAMAEAIATEARGIFHNASAHGDYSKQHGISCFAPFTNILRHPLWGRNQEVYGEDPYLASRMASSYVRGLQGDHPRYVRASSGCKTIGLYSGPENNPDRMSFSAVTSMRDMRLTYLQPFKACVEAGTYNLMCSYYKVNGVPSCANKWLMQDVMRDEYGFRGYVITDEFAFENMVNEFHFYKDMVEASAGAANAGVNLELPGQTPGYLHLYTAVQQGLVTLSTIKERVKPLFYTRMRLGEFDPPAMNPYTAINVSVLQSPQHRELATTIATQSFVLLKNDGFLPLHYQKTRLAAVGPFTDNLAILYGNYNPSPDPAYGTTVLKGLEFLADAVVSTAGCDDVHCHNYNQDAVKHAVVDEGPEAVFVALGTGTDIEQEGRDRTSLDLPENQTRLLMDAVKFANKKPVVLLLFTAGPVNISWAKHAVGVSAIIQCFFPAQSTGEALRRVLAITEQGVVSPAGRLPYTWPSSLDQVPSMLNYSMVGLTYRYFSGPGNPLYPFGYGLSYGSFRYSGLKLEHDKQNIIVSGRLTNIGKYPSDEVSQVYVSWVNCTVAMPQLQLVAINRTRVSPGETVVLQLSITADQLLVWDDVHGFIPFIGDVMVYLGGQQPGQTTSVGSNVLSAAVPIPSQPNSSTD